MTVLAVKSIVSVFVLSGVMGVIILLTAGTSDYWQAWIYLTIFTLVSLLTTIYLIKNDAALLERRMRGGPTAESRPIQKVIMLFTSLSFIALLVVPALDRRFGWTRLPNFVTVTGDALVVIGFYFIFRVYRENSYTSATIEIADGQKVIDTGPYAFVRHPMYAGALLYLLGTPLALGSYWGLLPFAIVISLLVWRLIDEEKMLTRDLQGYSDYVSRVPYRLLPGVW